MAPQSIKDALLERRALLIAPFAFAGLVALSSLGGKDSAQTTNPNQQVTIIEFDAQGRPRGAVRVKKLVKSESEWRRALSAEQFYVTRRKGTDTPYTGTYFLLHDPGLFRCICCGTTLFTSSTKFDSGTGWPSFWAPAAEENVQTVKDTRLLIERVEVRCRRCDAHSGHVFQDGPDPTGLRYCINESSLRFQPVVA